MFGVQLSLLLHSCSELTTVEKVKSKNELTHTNTEHMYVYRVLEKRKIEENVWNPAAKSANEHRILYWNIEFVANELLSATRFQQ